ncbi:hypothetical protein QL285_068838 [Trifolium repens]|nr:hypothetical protein QL285_068838 [Trifolium repens]
MVFCKGKLSGLMALKDLFDTYALQSGQRINTAKSTIYSGSITQGRLNLIINLLTFQIGSLPFNYLGIPIFRGKPKISWLQSTADKIHAKLSAWKASLLTMAGRVQLVRAVIQSMYTYNISIYSWHVSLIKKIEKDVKNFIWSGDVDKRKLVTVAWKKICRPLSQGGLNLRSLSCLNRSANLKLCWDLFHSHSSWAKLLLARIVRGKSVIRHHIYSSLWSSIKDEFSTLFDNSIWLLGDGKNISFWNDNWCGPALSEVFHIPDHISKRLVSSVSDYIVNGQWIIPPQLSQRFTNPRFLVHQVTIPLDPSHDLLLWKHTDSGELSFADAYNFISPQFQDLDWSKVLWNVDIPPSKSLVAWRLMHNKMPTDENLKLKGCSLPSMCSLCCKHEESSFHIFFECDFAVILWSWLANCLDMVLQFYTMEDMWKICDLNWAPQSKVVISSALINLLNGIWFARNQCRFNNTLINWQSIISMIKANVSLSGNNTRKVSSSSIRDFILLKNFNVCIHALAVPILKEVLWIPPLNHWLKCNVDGAAKGNPGLAGCGGVFRDHRAEFVYGFAEPLGNSSSIQAELFAVIFAIDVAFRMQWYNLWIETDSAFVVSAFQNSSIDVTWNLRNKWKNALVKFRLLNGMVSHIFREGNQVADSFANHACTITSPANWFQVPDFVMDSLEKNKFGIPCFRIC